MTELNNNIRRQEVAYLATLYCPNDEELMVSKTPLTQEDPDGELYGKYFKFLQDMFSLRGDLDDLSVYEIMTKKQELLDIAHEFRYPTKQILVLGAE